MNADFNITSKIRTDEGEDKVELFTVGEYSEADGVFLLSYDENEGIGYENCSVSISADGEKVFIQRTGPASSTFNIEKNVKHHSIYGTPFGDFTMGVNTYDVKNELTANGGRLWFKYSIDINSDFVSENEMEITVKIPGDHITAEIPDTDDLPR